MFIVDYFNKFCPLPFITEVFLLHYLNLHVFFLSFSDKPNTRHRSSGGSTDSAPQSPVGPAPSLPASENGMPLHRWSAKLG